MAKPRMRSFAQTAALDRILVFFDGPQVVLFRSDRGLPAVGVSVGEPDAEFYPLFVTEVLEANWKRYLAEKVDLRFLFTAGSKRRYFADWSSLEENGRLALSRADDVSPEEEDDLIPASGFWVRHQTASANQKSAINDEIASFAIDGAWDASDFSRFYGRAADLYAYMIVSTKDALNKLSSGSIDAVQEAIRGQSFRGGGSYVGFYDKIFNRVDQLSPLRVRRIAYASPGTIDLVGSPEALHDVSRVVESFGGDTGEIGEIYRRMDGALRRMGLKRAGPDAKFPTSKIENVVLTDALRLNQLLGVDDPMPMFDLCDRKVLVYAKVSLSFYRRAKDLYAFHAEGRVEAKAPSADIAP